ncbi:hypothetical protein V5799_022479 [Amblyomma americanum]|uniref:Uncharacterized protein n=1 Tax=Amblyomma americanum TaxID=6943 RepID=A0AAQ4FLY4_AMBAM
MRVRFAEARTFPFLEGHPAVQHERAPRGQPRRRLRSPATLCHGAGVGDSGVPPLCCPAPPLVSPLRDLCWSAAREPTEPARTTADAVPSSTTEEANGGDDQAPDSASTQRPGIASPPPPHGGIGPALASESSASSASLPSAAGLPPELVGGHPASLADLPGSTLPFLRGPIAMLPRPLLWWPLSEGVEAAAAAGEGSGGGLRGLQAVREAVARLSALQTDAAEYSCLKALALFRPGEKGYS